MSPGLVAQRRLGAFHAPLLAGIVAWLLVAALLGAALARERLQAIDHARREVAALSAVVEEFTARTFGSVDIALAGLADVLGTGEFAQDDPAVRERMRARLRLLPTVRALFVIGPDGWIRHDTDYPATPRVSLADRPYFRQYQQDPALQTRVSEALQSRSGTGWFVAVTRRITGPDGTFQGVVVAAVQLNWVSRLYTRMQLQDGQTLALLHSDGRLLARYPPADERIGHSYVQHELFTEHLRRSDAGVYRTAGPPLGYPRIVGYRTLDAQPLVVTLTKPMAAVLAPWQRTAAATLALLGLLAVSVFAGTRLYAQRREELRRVDAHRLAQAQAQAAADANAKFRTFFEQGCFFCCVLARDGAVLEVNDAGLRACGLRRDEVVGHKFWDGGWWRAGGENRARARAGFEAALAGGTVQIEADFRLASGTLRQVELALSPIRGEDDPVLSVAALAMDISARKALEHRLRRQTEDLESADRRKADFLATLSHELRNVLAPLQNSVIILERAEPGSAPAQRALGMVNKQLALLRSLVDDLLDVSRINSGKVRLQLDHLDLRELLATAAEAARAYMEGPGHRFLTDWPDAPLPVQADRARMLQVLTNLLGNAAKYTPAGGEVRLQARREGGSVIVEVIDNGIGMPAAAQARVFDMFQQVEQHLPHAQGGMGIGLSLVQRLVELHGGGVAAYSGGEGQGSRFTVTLPAVEAVPAAGAMVPAGGPGPQAARGSFTGGKV